jgi:hypothetical protein
MLVLNIPTTYCVTVDPGSNPDHDKLGGERGKFKVRRLNWNQIWIASKKKFAVGTTALYIVRVPTLDYCKV